jgi:hypothetical protein
MRYQDTTPVDFNATSNGEKEDRILRYQHDPEHPYLIVTKQLVDDPTISMECAYLLMKILAKPKDWIIRISSLAKELSGRCGERKLYKLIAEAINAGYLKRVDIKENGRRIRCDYYMSEFASFREDSNNFARNGRNRNRENDHDILSNDKTNIQRNRESALPVAASAKMQTKQEVRADGVVLLKDYMTGKKPNPGPKDMVKKSMELLASPFHYKGRRYLMSEHDRQYFVGFSPAVIIEAIERMNKHKGSGKTGIHNPVSYIFAKCCEIRKE